MPTKVAEVELAAPLAVSPPPARYERLRLLLRRGGAPLGYVDLANRPSLLAPDDIARTVASVYSPELWARERLPTLDQLPRTRPLVSVVVCATAVPGGLERCLAALAAQDYARHEALVVSTAAGAAAGAETAKRWGVRHLVEPTGRLDCARNRGLAAARGRVVAYTDDRSEPDQGWLAALVAGFSSPDVAGVTGLVAPAELETHAQLLFEDVSGGMGKGFLPRLHTLRGRRLTYAPRRCGVGCNMAFDRRALLRLGGFDPSLDAGTASGAGGDLDVFQRLLETDAVIAYRPDALVFHLHWRSQEQLRRKLFADGRGDGSMLAAAFLRARGRGRLGVVAAGAHTLVFGHGRRLLRRLLLRERLPLHLILAETLGMLVGPVCFLAARHRARRVVRSGSRP